MSQTTDKTAVTGTRRVRNPRRRILKTGLVCFNQRYSTLPCVVRDLSEAGARLTVQSAMSVPDTFELYIELDGLWARCEVVWRGPDAVGVRFREPPQYEAPARRQVLEIVDPTLKPSLRKQPPKR